ncbi:glycosyltransferase [Clostridium sp.]|uniref:glycosyltransferase family 2 protein n=1 Tax=Clostridium sp. TaxID=1506 RepID=UPI0025BFF58A|nr:glycosyltransferase [Clostridium sp.]
MFVSVIIPVYNVEDYIEECLNSVLRQTLTNIEIIIVNDGTKDSSIEKVSKYKDERIVIINKENGGLSSARNTGLRIAKGKYTYFIDSDDFLLYNNCFEEMYKIAESDLSEIVVGNGYKYYSKNNMKELYRDKNIFKRSTMNSKDFLIKFINSDSMQTPVYYNMYKTDFLKQNSLFFKEGRIHEDQEFITRAFVLSNKVSIYPTSFYAYRQREGSIMSGTKKELSVQHAIMNCFELEEYYNENVSDIELKKVLLNKLVSQMLYSFSNSKYENINIEYKKFLLRNSFKIKNKIKTVMFLSYRRFYYKIYCDRKLKV